MKVTVCVECKGSKSGNLKSNRRIVDKAPWAEVVIRRVIKTAAQKLAGATLSHGYRAPNTSASSGQAEMWTLTDSITQLTASRASSNHEIIKRSTRVTSWTDMPRLRPGQEGGACRKRESFDTPTANFMPLTVHVLVLWLLPFGTRKCSKIQPFPYSCRNTR